MIDGLSTESALVDNNPVASRVLFSTELPRDAEESCNQFGVLPADERGEIFHMFDRHYQQMFGRHRMRVNNRDDVVVSVGKLGRDFARDNFAENAIVVHGYVFGLRSSKLMWVSGLGTYPAIEDFIAIGTVV